MLAKRQLKGKWNLPREVVKGVLKGLKRFQPAKLKPSKMRLNQPTLQPKPPMPAELGSVLTPQLGTGGRRQEGRARHAPAAGLAVDGF